MIAQKYFEDSPRLSNDARGLVSYTGKYRDMEIWVTTSGMGGEETKRFKVYRKGEILAHCPRACCFV